MLNSFATAATGQSEKNILALYLRQDLYTDEHGREIGSGAIMLKALYHDRTVEEELCSGNWAAATKRAEAYFRLSRDSSLTQIDKNRFLAIDAARLERADTLNDMCLVSFKMDKGPNLAISIPCDSRVQATALAKACGGAKRETERAARLRAFRVIEGGPL